MTKIFFFDIDNTLLDHRTNRITESALHAIETLKQAGHVIAVATGRSHHHAQEYLDVIKPAYAVLQNGAYILRENKVLDKTLLAHQPLMRLFADVHARGYYYGINGVTGGHVSARVDEVMIPMDSVDINVNVDMDFYQNTEILQGWLFFDEHLDETLIPQFIVDYPEFDFVRWHQTALDILPKGVNKLTGCQKVLNDLGFGMAQAYAFGDGLNDIEMLQGVGTGIAMGNAHPRLKEVADRVTDAIHLDGIANMLKVLQEEWQSASV
ncbi:Cof-type HAD-IIB family hydrolase [Hydromonas duriensis]|uniref:Cof subfamily protein (Haloacid dehalogenase superfamily)/HAD superfamily hydrolase (TIGR01484 family) n=1 Tax=Hydromonas duriensis TaxID=1527608 RepID=A0A4R6Y583_9BURK|nr:Cof-type HAD-IIB family hydrolase [Hydromonas duriensis]TDR30510.1 hypothetical protein DFR44_12020 [Hydromonas duriensis]